MTRFGVDARWLTHGPPSGRRFVRGLLDGLADHPQRPDLVLFAADGFAPHSAHMSIRHLPDAPGPVFNAVEIQAVLPRDVAAVLYQSYTPPWSRAGRAVVVHDLIYLTRPEFFTRTERAYFSLIVRLLPRAEVVVAVSEYVRTEILERFPRRDPATVRVVPNGVDRRFLLDTKARAASAQQTRETFGLDRPYVIVVGRINPRKNLARLVRAIDSLALDGTDLVLAGPPEGPRDTELEAAIRGVRRIRIRRLGHVPDTELPGLYAGALVSCYVSLDEGFGIPPLEAMATGTAALVSDIPALREVVADAALRVDPYSIEAIAEGLGSLIQDEGLRAEKAAAGRARADRFSWRSSADSAITALRDAAGLRGDTRRAAG